MKDQTDALPEHSIPRSILLHLLPGAFLALVYILTAPLFMEAGWPAFTAFLLAIVLVLVPFELGVLLFLGYQKNGRLSFQGVVLYRESIPLWQYFAFIPLLFIVSLAGAISISFLDDLLLKYIFFWVPEWLMLSGFFETALQYSPSIRAVNIIGYLVLAGIIAPVIEELYFRGFLLPRLEFLKGWSPLVNALLFSIYHLWSPWQIPSRIAILLPLIYVVRRKKNIYLSIFVHCALNTLLALPSIALILNKKRRTGSKSLSRYII
jgi:membrane protease YdiL (CAAX protease family)